MDLPCRNVQAFSTSLLSYLSKKRQKKNCHKRFEVLVFLWQLEFCEPKFRSGHGSFNSGYNQITLQLVSDSGYKSARFDLEISLPGLHC
jgi:hypothetical protein